MIVCTFGDALRYLGLFTDFERGQRVLFGHSAFRLKRTVRLMRGLGNPQRRYPVVHVTGSKGKGTTATLIAAIARAHGLRVGLYTSPHLLDMRERIRVDGDPIPPREFARTLDRVLGVVLGRPADRVRVRKALARGRDAARAPLPDRFPTYFEILTALAFEHFRNVRVDLAVIEVGLGGRLDATNVVRPEVSVISRIELEHTDVLGSTREAIAREKAGIIKRGARVVVGPMAPGPWREIRRVAARWEAPVWRVGRALRAREVTALRGRRPALRFRLEGPGVSLPGVRLALLGRHQADNALLAVGATLELARRGFLRWDPRAVRRALAGTPVPGRTEVLPGPPTVVVDCCHTVESARALARTVRAYWPGARRRLVFGALGGKDWQGMLRALGPAFTAGVAFVPVSSPRSWNPEEGPERIAPRPARVFPDLAAALVAVRAASSAQDLVVVAGSVYLAGAALRLLRRQTPEAPRS